MYSTCYYAKLIRSEPYRDSDSLPTIKQLTPLTFLVRYTIIAMFRNSRRATTDNPSPAHWSMIHWFVASIAVAMISTALWQFITPRLQLDITRLWIAETPVTVYQLPNTTSAPVVVIAHGFAGSQQIMQAFATTLAHNGYIAVTFDFPGHGRHHQPLAGSLGSEERTAALLATLDTVIRQVQTWPGSNGQLAILGHSMAGDSVVRYAQTHHNSDAVIALSPYLALPVSSIAADNLLLLYGAWEPERMHKQGFALVEATPGTAQIEHTTNPTSTSKGIPGNDPARKMVVIDNVEHIGILYSSEAFRVILDWLQATFQRPASSTTPWLDQRAGAFALLYGGIVLFLWPCVQFLPRFATKRLGAATLPRRSWWLIAILPAILTPVLLRLVPTDIMPLLIGDYLALHCACYGLLTLLGLSLVNAWPPTRHMMQPHSLATWAWVLIGWSGFVVVAFALPTQHFVTNFLPDGHRLPYFATLLAAMLLYTVADAWLVYGRSGFSIHGIITKLLFLFSLAIAIALNLQALFFLVIIIPAFVILLALLGIINQWVYHRTWHPFIHACASASLLALTVSVIFPVVG
jgi:hypothetical protein